MILRSGRRCNVIVKPAVLIVGKKDDRILPVRTVPHRADHLRNISLASLDVGGWMLIVFGRGSGQAKIGIHKGNRRQGARRSLSKKSCQWQEVRINARGAAWR